MCYFQFNFIDFHLPPSTQMITMIVNKENIWWAKTPDSDYAHHYLQPSFSIIHSIFPL